MHITEPRVDFSVANDFSFATEVDAGVEAELIADDDDADVGPIPPITGDEDDDEDEVDDVDDRCEVVASDPEWTDRPWRGLGAALVPGLVVCEYRTLSMIASISLLSRRPSAGM